MKPHVKQGVHAFSTPAPSTSHPKPDNSTEFPVLVSRSPSIPLPYTIPLVRFHVGTLRSEIRHRAIPPPPPIGTVPREAPCLALTVPRAAREGCAPARPEGPGPVPTVHNTLSRRAKYPRRLGAGRPGAFAAQPRGSATLPPMPIPCGGRIGMLYWHPFPPRAPKKAAKIENFTRDLKSHTQSRSCPETRLQTPLPPNRFR